MHSPCLEDALEQERILQPWEQHPRELVNWFDMLQFSAHAFFWCGRALRGIKADCHIGSIIILPGESEPAFAMAQDLDEKARTKATTSLRSVEVEFRKIGLEITAETVKEISEEIGTGSRHSFDWLHTQIETIEKLAAKEIKGKAFFYIPPERSRFWPKMKEPYAFGEAVARSFPSSIDDVNHAAISLATGLSTGSVFYLMRVLEIGLTSMGNQFSVSLAHTNWAPAIEQIESRIREMHKHAYWKTLPDCKEQQEFFAQAASHFAILKDACRNPTMHARAKYTDDEAERLFETVKAFMQKLAEKLDDNLIPIPW